MKTEPTRSEPAIALCVIDLVNTVLVHENQQRRRTVTVQLYRNFGFLRPQDSPGTLPSNISDEQILADVNQVRREYVVMKQHRDRWPIVNMRAYEKWLPTADPRHKFARMYGKRVHEALVGNPDLYTVQVGMRKIIEWMIGRGIAVCILSNAPCASVYRLIQHHGIADLFSGIYCPEELGGHWKPDIEAWRTVMLRESKKLGLCDPLRPEQVMHIGNSLNTDTGAAELGAQVLLFNKEENLHFLREEGAHETPPDRVIIPEQEIDHVRYLVRQGLVHLCSSQGQLFEKIRSLCEIPAALT